MPALLGGELPPRPYLYWELQEGVPNQAVRIGDWKAAEPAPNKPVELYNLKTDPGEQHDVGAAHPDMLQRATELMTTARTPSPLWPLTMPMKKAGPKAQE